MPVLFIVLRLHNVACDAYLFLPLSPPLSLSLPLYLSFSLSLSVSLSPLPVSLSPSPHLSPHLSPASPLAAAGLPRRRGGGEGGDDVPWRVSAGRVMRHRQRPTPPPVAALAR